MPIYLKLLNHINYIFLRNSYEPSQISHSYSFSNFAEVPNLFPKLPTLPQFSHSSNFSCCLLIPSATDSSSHRSPFFSSSLVQWSSLATSCARTSYARLGFRFRSSVSCRLRLLLLLIRRSPSAFSGPMRTLIWKLFDLDSSFKRGSRRRRRSSYFPASASAPFIPPPPRMHSALVYYDIYSFKKLS